VDVVDPSPALKQLMHEADHLSLFCAEVTDGCSCNCACGECLHGVQRDSFTFYCFVGMTAVSTGRNSVLQKMGWCGVMEQCVILQYCVVSKCGGVE